MAEGKDAVKTRPSEKKPAAPDVILASKQEVADELKLSVYQFAQLLRRYPFPAGKLNGRWHVVRGDVWRWYGYVKSQELRHPEARRMRPEEPPDVKGIVGR